ncbi:MAG: LacI family transcriptional regulator [Candidatus Nanopelagicales bacterium]|nr:LacI family transcriptional regulator [Candidatus Nanopelagicales bacterium]
MSIATVSRALSGTRPMSEELRDQVLASVEALGYQVNLVGRALRQKRTATLGLIIPDLENPFFSALAQQVSRGFADTQTDILVISADNFIELEMRAVRSFLGRQVDGLLMIPCDEEASAAAVKLASSYVPTVQLDRLVSKAKTPYVGCDNAAGIALIVSHIDANVDEDLQPVIYIGGGGSTSSGRQRLQEFTKLRPDCQVLDGEFTFDWGREAARRIIDRGFCRGTVVTAADVIALGVTSQLISSGYSIPNDFRIIGFDDVGLSYLAHPTLTTVRQPLDLMTDSILRLMLMQEHSTSDIERKTHAPELVVRESSPLATEDQQRQSPSRA